MDIEYTWNRQAVRKTMNIFVKIADWHQGMNGGRGGVKATYGSEAKRINAVLLSKVEKVDAMLAEFAEKNPGKITIDVINSYLLDKPMTRNDEGKDFVDFVNERLDSEYARNKIGRSRHQNGKSGMNIFQEFLRSTNRGTHKANGIYLGELTIELLDAYIAWRRDIKLNSDHTINHALTPILKACAYASELDLIDKALNARIQDMRISPKISLATDEAEFDGKSLSKEEVKKLIKYHDTCQEPRRKEFIEMFLFAFHACGLRLVDVMTLQWTHIDFQKKELRKVMVKTNKRHVIPLSEPAIEILMGWYAKRPNTKFVFNLVKEELDIDNADSLYKARNNATNCINQSLTVVGEQMELAFPLTMHVARHTFAVFALNKGLSMTVVSRLLGHGSTDVTEKVYVRFLPETLSTELTKLKDELSELAY